VASRSEWILQAKVNERISDRETKDLDLTSIAIPGGRLLTRTLRALSADLYRPVPLLELQDRIFHGELTSTDAGRTKVRQLLTRLRQGLRQAKLPVTVVQRAGFYSVEAVRDPVRLIIGTAAGVDFRSEDLSRLERLRDSLVGGISSEDAAKLLLASRPTAYRLLEDWVKSGQGVRVRGSKELRYFSRMTSEGVARGGSRQSKN
jgi:hypothetical protein